MLRQVDVVLLTGQQLSQSDAVGLHGLMFERLSEMGDGELASSLHGSSLHAYTQRLELRDDGNWHWVLSFLDDCLYERMWVGALSGQREVFLRKRGLSLGFGAVTERAMSMEDLYGIFTCGDSHRIFVLKLVSPVAFKQGGEYVFHPDLGLIYQSLVMKYNAAVKGDSLSDPQLLDQLLSCTKIEFYNLRSVKFSVGEAVIPSFMGKIGIKCYGNSTMSRFLNMLLAFGSYSGIGIKCSMGMGGIELAQNQRGNLNKFSQ